MSLTIRPRLGLATAIAGAAIVLAACSSAATPTPAAPTAPPTAAPTEAPSAAPSAAASQAPSAAASQAAGAGGLALAAASGTVGPYLTGADGKTLYVYAKDTTPVQEVSATWAVRHQLAAAHGTCRRGRDRGHRRERHDRHGHP